MKNNDLRTIYEFIGIEKEFFQSNFFPLKYEKFRKVETFKSSGKLSVSKFHKNKRYRVGQIKKSCSSIINL